MYCDVPEPQIGWLLNGCGTDGSHGTLVCRATSHHVGRRNYNSWFGARSNKASIKVDDNRRSSAATPAHRLAPVGATFTCPAGSPIHGAQIGLCGRREYNWPAELLLLLQKGSERFRGWSRSGEVRIFFSIRCFGRIDCARPANFALPFGPAQKLLVLGRAAAIGARFFQQLNPVVRTRRDPTICKQPGRGHIRENTVPCGGVGSM